MTSNNQAFVKTFSRRARAAGIESSLPSNSPVTKTAVVRPVANGVEAGSAQPITRIDPPQAAVIPRQHETSHAPPQQGSDVVAQAVAKQQQTVSLQHTHTAYASAAIEIDRSSHVQTTTPVLPPESNQPTAEVFDLDPHKTPRPHHKVTAGPTIELEERPAPKRTIEPFQAVWEVNVFDVPTIVADLFFDGKRYQQIAEHMSDAVQNGLQTVLVTSSQSGEGRSSVAIGIAMAAAASGIRVALVDADTTKPTLAEDLRLDLQYGWVDTVRGGLPIKEVAVRAVEDGVTLIPLMPPNGQTAATAYEVSRLVNTLKVHFDLLIMDGPAADSPEVLQIAPAFDSAVVVRDVTRTDDQVVNKIASQLRDAGIQGIGVAENFV